MSQRRRRARDRRMVAGSRRLAATDDAALTAPTQRVPVRSRVNTVDRLTNRPIPPLTDIQAEVLAALTDVPAWPKALAGRCSLTERQVHSGVYALSAKGLAVRTAGGWRLVA
jgi:predicted Rossmann fold nucleotide-binding protein DprA/Smf involved in DNA uptake